jgi:N-acetylglucosaminyldiphosphoundecaprenol N-acetyl-beta-D-mannosaminyltransferase
MNHGIGSEYKMRTSDRTRVSFCSMPFDIVGLTDLLLALEGRPLHYPFAYITTPNVDHVVRLESDCANLLPLYKSAWMTVCDSRVLASLAAPGGRSLPVITGADLTEALLTTVIKPSDRINIIGADRNVIRRLRAKFQLDEINHLMPPMSLNEQPHQIEKCVDFIDNNPARFTFLAVGSPQQEKIAHGVWSRGTATGIGLCIGTSLQFSAGVISRASPWIQRLRLEWLHRLAQEPGRLSRRYLVEDVRILRLVFRHLMRESGMSGRRGVN